MLMSTTQDASVHTNTYIHTESDEAHQNSPKALSDVVSKVGLQEKMVDNEAEQQAPKGLTLALIMLSIYASMFLVALVNHSSPLLLLIF